MIGGNIVTFVVMQSRLTGGDEVVHAICEVSQAVGDVEGKEQT